MNVQATRHAAIGPPLLEVAHVAHRLGVCQEWVRRLIRERKLPAIQLGTRWRVDPGDLQAFTDALMSTDKFYCPRCGAFKSRVVDSRPDTGK